MTVLSELFQGIAQRDRTLIAAHRKIVRPPDAVALPLIDLDRPVDHDRRRRVAIVNRRRIDQRLERRSRLPIGLCRAIELALVEREAADHRDHAAGQRVHRDHGAGHFRHLPQAILALDHLAFLVEQRIGVDHVTRRQNLRDRSRRRFAARRGGDRLRPSDTVQRDETGLPLLGDGAAEFAAGLKTDAGRLVGCLQHHGHPPGRDVAQRFDLGELHAPVAGNVQLAHGAAPALRLVEIHEAGGHGLARHHLQLRIERGADRQAAFIEFLFAVALEDVAPDFLGKILAGKRMRGVGPGGHDQRFLARLVGIGLLDPAVFQQAVDHVIAPLDRTVAVAHRMQRSRRFRKRGQIRGFGDRQLVHRFVEIDQRRGGDAVGAEAEIDFVEIEFEDAVLRIGALDAHRQQGFLDLAGEGDLVGQKEVLRDLLGDRRGALRTAVGAEFCAYTTAARAMPVKSMPPCS